MPILVKVLMMVVGVYLVGVYIVRFSLALRLGELNDDEDMISCMWPLVLLLCFLDWLVDRIVWVWPKISRPFKISMHYLGICLYWIFLPFRPTVLGKSLHNLLLRKGNAQ